MNKFDREKLADNMELKEDEVFIVNRRGEGYSRRAWIASTSLQLDAILTYSEHEVSSVCKVKLLEQYKF